MNSATPTVSDAVESFILWADSLDLSEDIPATAVIPWARQLHAAVIHQRQAGKIGPNVADAVAAWSAKAWPTSGDASLDRRVRLSAITTAFAELVAAECRLYKARGFDIGPTIAAIMATCARAAKAPPQNPRDIIPVLIASAWAHSMADGHNRVAECIAHIAAIPPPAIK